LEFNERHCEFNENDEITETSMNFIENQWANNEPSMATIIFIENVGNSIEAIANSVSAIEI